MQLGTSTVFWNRARVGARGKYLQVKRQVCGIICVNYPHYGTQYAMFIAVESLRTVAPSRLYVLGVEVGPFYSLSSGSRVAVVIVDTC